MIIIMQILIFAIGKESSQSILELQKEYERRLKTLANISWKLLPASRSTDSQQVRDDESTALLSQLKSSDTVILLDERGIQQTNEEFASTFERLAGSHGRIIFIIGGAYGVNQALRARASFIWSFSKLVFPHQLIRVMLLEQIYRSFMVLNNHPYHHT